MYVYILFNTHAFTCIYNQSFSIVRQLIDYSTQIDSKKIDSQFICIALILFLSL